MTMSVELALPPDKALSDAPPGLDKAMQQSRLLADPLSRKDVLTYEIRWPLRTVRCSVVRNTPVESIAAAARPFLGHAGLAVDWTYSAYDDSLGLADFDASADLVLVWLDFSRYGLESPAWRGFLEDRLLAIRTRTPAPILIADAPGDVPSAEAIEAALANVLARIPGLAIYPRSATARDLGLAYRDVRLSKVAGSDLSGPATLSHARDIGMSWIPALVQPAVKCLALDLDNTLYSGVLGEDGPSGVKLTNAHKLLQERLVGLQAQGFLLAVVSKNEAADVQELFQLRTDFPIRPELVSAWAVSWNAKAQGLTDIARRLNIGVDALLFVDDNLGEIASTAAAHPDTPVLYAADPAEAMRGLAWLPGLRRLRFGREDALRAADLAAKAERERLTGVGRDYVTALKPKLTFRFADESSIGRLHELSNKTNQFNLAVARLSAAQAAALALEGRDSGALGCTLSDALSDSGVILSMFGKADGSTLIVEDLCISCRALGRNLEDKMILEGALKLADRLGCQAIGFRYRRGPRNGPALTWLAALTDDTVENDEGIVVISLDDAGRKIAGAQVETLWGPAG
jgi:FkbH-like protein